MKDIKRKKMIFWDNLGTVRGKKAFFTHEGDNQ